MVLFFALNVSRGDAEFYYIHHVRKNQISKDAIEKKMKLLQES